MENINPDLGKVKELAIKLKAMADRGTEHERVVAENKLSSLLKKYGLSLQYIQENKIKQRIFPFKCEDETMIVAHVIWSVAPKISIQRKGKQKKAFCKLNPEQYIEVKEKLKFYLANYAEQKRSFVVAYILKNNLEVESDSESIGNSDLNYDSL